MPAKAHRWGHGDVIVGQLPCSQIPAQIFRYGAPGFRFHSGKFKWNARVFRAVQRWTFSTTLQEMKEAKQHYVKEMFISLMNTYSTLFEHKKCNMHSNYSNVQYKILLHT